MPLSHGYGVVIGTLHKYYRDPENNYGQYFHGNVEVQTPAGIYECPIDVDSKSLPNGVEWRVVELGASPLKGIAARPNGWHKLASTPASGALDYVRSTELRQRVGCLPIIYNPALEGLRRAWEDHINRWKSGNSKEALADLEPLLVNPKRLFIFGEPYTKDLGVHNIHQNQGDPPETKWAAENGIWQDGATLIERQDGSIVAFLNKFKSQSYETDDLGRKI